MIRPITIHPKAVNWVVASNEMIMAVQTRMPNVDTTGTIGVLNGRTASGLDLLMIHTPALTNTNANRVPILVRSPARLPGTKAAKAPTKTKRIRFDLYGVLNFG